MVRKVSILCMVASLLFSLEAATPLVTQYIAPVDNPSWDNAVTNGYSNGIDYLPHIVDGYYNYSILIGETLYVTWNSYVQFKSILYPSASYANSWRRSVLNPPTSPSKRYLYSWLDVRTNKKTIESNTDRFPNDTVVVSARLDTDKTKATYVQCVHTDWVYKVTFDANGGGGSMGEFVFTNSAALPANAFSRTGYDFSKWDTSPSGSGQYNDCATVAHDLKLYAIWSACQYTLTFDSCGGSDVSGSETVTYDSTYGTLPTPTRPGYNFAGWYTEPFGGGKVARGDKVSIASDHTLYAHWVASSIKVTLNLNAGGDSSASIDGDAGEKTVNYDSEYGELPSATRSGYEFLGWWTSASDGVKIESDTKVSLQDNHTLYAHWQDNTVNVRFDAGEGFIGNVSVTNVIGVYEKGTNCGSLPIPTNSVSSRSFAGWWTSTNPVDRVQILSTNIVDAAITNLYARWKAVVSEKTCTLTFYLADGKPSTNVTAIVGDEFGRWFLDPEPQYTGGYRHFGWYREDGSRVERVEETDIIEGDTKLTGRWTLGAFNDAWNCTNVQFETSGKYVSGWTMDEAKVARSGDVSGLGTDVTAESYLSMTSAVSGTLSIKLKTSCLPEHPDLHWLACLDINSESESDRIGGPDASWNKSIHLEANSQFELRYYRYGGDYSAKYYPPIDDEIEDCAWASDFSFVPDAALPEWTALADKTLSAKTGGSASWVVADDHDSLVITNLPNARSGWVALETTKNRAGVLEFKWRTSCEGGYVDTNGVYQVCDRLEFQDERGERTLRIEGVMSDWESVVWTNSVESAHTFTWRYVKDGDTSAGDDAAWIKDVKWTPFPPEPKPFRVLIW